MQRSSGHSVYSVITPASTSRAQAPKRRLTARERSNMVMPCPQDIFLAKFFAFLETTQDRFDAEPDTSPASQARRQATLAVTQSPLPPQKSRAGSAGAKQSRTLSKAVSHD